MKRLFFSHGVPLLLLFSLLFSVFVLSVYPIEAEDLFSNIASGKYIVEHRSIPSIDPFSYTGPFRWFFDRALSSVVFYFLHEIGGFTAIILFTFSILALSYGFIYFFFVKKHIHPLIPFLILSLIIPASSYWFLTRSFIFGFIFFVLFLTILLSENKKFQWTLIPLQILWTNLHSSSILGFLFSWLYWICTSKKDRKSLILPVAVTLVNVISPVGFQFFPRIWWELTAPHASRGNIYEWFSPFHPTIIQQPLAVWFVLSLLILPVPFILIATKTIKVQKLLFLSILTLVMVGLSIQSARHIPLYYLALSFLIVQMISLLQSILPDHVLHTIKKYLPSVSLLSILLSLSVSVFILFHGYSNGANIRRVGFGINTKKFPEALFSKLLELKPPGNIFSEYGYGSYSVYKMYPEYKVYIDGGRLDQVYGEDFYQHYLKIGTDEKTLLEDIKKYSLSAFVLPTPSSPEAIVNIYRYLSVDPLWKLWYFDDFHMVFIQSDMAKEKNISTYKLLNPLLDIQGILQNKDTNRAFEQELESAEKTLPKSFTLLSLRIAFLDSINQGPAVQNLLGELARYCTGDNDTPACNMRLALQYLKYGQLSKAYALRNKLTSWVSRSSYPYILRADIASRVGKYAEAVQSYKTALTLSDSPQEHASLSAMLKEAIDRNTQQ